jgi:Fe-S-cluster containining protein
MAHTAYKETAGILREQLREAQLDHEAFEQKIKPCELARCRATCCHDGVYLSAEEADGIQALLQKHGGQLRAYGLQLPEQSIIASRGGKSLKTATRDAEDGELADDYPAHFPKTRCVFLDEEHRCVLQRLAVEEGKHPWFWKPISCWMQPLRLEQRGQERPVLTLPGAQNDPMKRDGYPGFSSCTGCGREEAGGAKAGVTLKAELEMLGDLGERDLVREVG